ALTPSLTHPMGEGVRRTGEGKLQRLSNMRYFRLDMSCVGQVRAAGFVAIGKKNSVEQRNVIRRELRRDGAIITARHKCEPGIYFPRAIEHALQFFRRKKFQVVREIINAPRHEI